MKKQQFVLFVIINDVKHTKKVTSKLKEMGIQSYTVIDSLGTNNLYNTKKHIDFEPIIGGTMKSSIDHMDKKYNKTLYVILNCEEEVIKVMDELEKVIKYDKKKPGKGIMFSIPVYMSQGIREQSVICKCNCE